MGPIGKRIEAAGYRVRHDKVDVGVSVTLRHKGKLHHIGIGCPYAGWRVILLVDGLDIRILCGFFSALPLQSRPPTRPSTTSGSLEAGNWPGPHDVAVARHRSPMSRYITFAAPTGFEPVSPP